MATLLVALCVSNAILQVGGNVGCPNRCGIDKKVPRGRCEYGSTPVCNCIEQFNGRAGDCSERACPTALAWFDRPSARDTAHTTMLECSGRGSCSKSTGACICDKDFEGPACEQSRCPVSLAGMCSGHGRCATLREAASMRAPEPTIYEAWDADRIKGCFCDEGWGSYDCSEKLCPVNADPLVIGQAEVQNVTTYVPYGAEVQTISIVGAATSGGTGAGGNADVNEVQQVDVLGSLALPTGSFKLALDCRSTIAQAGCKLWPDSRRVQGITAQVTIDAGSASVTAGRVQTALEALPMIGAGQVTVTGTITGFTHRFLITFSGALVAGNIYPISVDTTSLAVSSGTFSSANTLIQDGSEITGVLDLSWDDTASFPNAAALAAAACLDNEDGTKLNTLGIKTGSVSATETEAAIQSVLYNIIFGCTNGVAPCTEVPATNAILVSKVLVDGPGLNIVITFAAGARARGDVAPLVVVATTATSVASASVPLVGSSSTVTAAETAKGVFLTGSWSAILYYKADSEGNLDPTPALATVPWCASATSVATMLNSYESRFGYGPLSVNRARKYHVGGGPGGTDVWTGGYDWTVTFRGIAEDANMLDTDSTSLALSGGGAGFSLSVSEVSAGGPGARISEVQLIDCTCGAACNDAATQYIRLAYKQLVTDPIPFNANAASVRAALRALPGIPDVKVQQHASGGVAGTTLCAANGVTTAITFGWNSGPQPPLRIAGSPLTDGSTLPLSSVIRLHAGRGFGLQGGRAKRGTRVPVACSGRGRCDPLGSCICYPGWEAGDGGQPPEAPPVAAANSLDIADTIGDCGFPTGGIWTVTSCPSNNTQLSACSGHGVCSGSPEFACACTAGYTGPACDIRSCVTAPSWFNVPLYADPMDTGIVSPGPGGNTVAYTVASAHLSAACGGAGRCGSDSGTCLCRAGWGGLSCTKVPCPGQAGTMGVVVNETCFNGAPCVDLVTVASSFYLDASSKSLLGPGSIDPSGNGAEVYTAPWDANGFMRGCVCEALEPQFLGPYGYNYGRRSGYACAEMTCPGGPDPEDPRAFDEVYEQWEIQSIKCTIDQVLAPKGRAAFNWRNASGTVGIKISAYVFDKDRPGDPQAQDLATLETALMNVPGMMPVLISIFASPTATQPKWCDPAGTTEIRVLFVGNPGDHPNVVITPDTQALLGGGAITVTEVRKGTGVSYECNRRGVCDRVTGRCSCLPDFSSGDGYGKPGQRGDCSYYVTAVNPERSEF